MINREQDRSLDNLQVVDPLEFLSDPDNPLHIGVLAQPPTLELLKYLPTLSDETGLVYKDQQWRIVKGFMGIGVLVRFMPKDADVLMHSHYRSTRTTPSKGIGLEIPSTGDFYNCTPTGKNFVISPDGITEYSLSLPQDQLDQIFIDPVESAVLGVKMKRKSIDVLQSNPAVYRGFLRSIEAEYKFLGWEEITDEKLANLLSKSTDDRSP